MKSIFASIWMTLALLGVATAVTHKAVEGTPGAVQTAINNAAPGSTVEIANGTYTWTSGIHLNKAIILRGQSNHGVKLIGNDMTSNLIEVTEPAAGNAEIYNLDIDFSIEGQNYWPYAVVVSPSNPRGSGRVLLHDCVFVATGWNYTVEWATNGGVIWNCTFDGIQSGGLAGIKFVPRNLAPSWTTLATFGTDDKDGLTNTYMEDCVCRNNAAVDFDDNSRVVVRHCQWENSVASSHGQETSPQGARHWEVYDCQFKYVSASANAHKLQCFIDVRGGTGVITDNYLEDIPSKPQIVMEVQSIRRRAQIPCQTQYPAARQIGQGWIGEGGYSYPSVPANGTGYFTDPITIWNNTGPGTTVSDFIGLLQYEPDECGNGMKIGNFVKEGRDYKLEPRIGYHKYPYPQPLRGEGGGGPVPTPEPPRPTPTVSATPTPAPTATPEPTPGASSYRNWLDQLGEWIRQHPATPD
jgi:hypothetical protein